MSFSSLFRGVFVVGLCVVGLPGCGGNAGYHVSGVVNFDGKPVPSGQIYFIPDNSKKNSGATGFATIKNGAYDTAASGGKLQAGGPMLVKIEGFDPSAKGPQIAGDTSGEVTVKSLFPAYETSVNLPKANAKQSFDVPAEAANRKIAPETSAHTGP